MVTEYPNLWQVFEDNSFLAQDYANEVLGVIATLYTLVYEHPLSEAYLDVGDFDRAAEFDPATMLSHYLDALDYPVFLRSFLAKKISKQLITPEEAEQQTNFILRLLRENLEFDNINQEDNQSIFDKVERLMITEKATEFEPFLNQVPIETLVDLALMSDDELFTEIQKLMPR